MPGLRPEEEWVRSVMEAELGRPVVQHDDGSRPGMHDLDVVERGERRGAVEVTGAVDAASTELWNVANGDGRWVEPDLAGGWLVQIGPGSRRLRRELPSFLRALERAGIRRYPDPTAGPALDLAAGRLRVVGARQGGTDFPGSIYVTPDLPLDQLAGFTLSSGDALAHWVGEFLRDDARADVRAKLARSGAPRRHAFVVVSGLSGAPFGVSDLLMRAHAPVPGVPADLPSEVTDVWLASTWDSGVGFRWSSVSGAWRTFPKRLSAAPPR